MAYFDNAATTFPKPKEVYSFMNDFYKNNGGSVGRGNYELAVTAKDIVDDTRKRLLTLFHCPAKNVVFVPTATIALNIIIQGLIKDGVRNVYISPFEHNAVTRILHHYEVEGKITVIILKVTQDLEYDMQQIKCQFEETAPDLVVVSHASNVIGLVSPVEIIFQMAKQYNSYTVVDMAQTAGLVDINLGLETIDFAVFAGHKSLLGPMGISGFIFSSSVKPSPVLFGGTGFDSANPNMPDSIPEKYEMGTLNTMAIAGLNAAIKWIENKTVSELFVEEQKKRSKLLSILKKYRFIKIVGNKEDRKYIGIVSCLFESISSDSAGVLFSNNGIAVRAGLQCAPNAHKFLGTFPAGTIRLSVNSFTTDEDFQELIEFLDYIEDEI